MVETVPDVDLDSFNPANFDFSDPLNNPVVKRLVLKCRTSSYNLARTFLRESFFLKQTWQTKKVWDLLDDDTIPRLAVCGWRGLGKTTMMTARIVRGILYRQIKYVGIVGYNEGYATHLTENLKQIITSKESITSVFGNLIPDRVKTSRGSSFSKESYYLVDPTTGQQICFVQPIGLKEGHRGFNIYIDGQLYRPDFLWVDDVEKDEDLKTPESRKEIREKLWGALGYAINTQYRPNANKRWEPDPKNPFWTPPYRFCYLDTYKDDDANIAHILEDPEWTSVVLPQAEVIEVSKDKYEYFSCVEEAVSHEEVRAEAAAAERRGMLHVYAREKMCRPFSPTNQCWTRGLFRYFDTKYDERTLQKDPDVLRFIVVDPARTDEENANPKTCPTAMMSVAVDFKLHRICFRKFVLEYLGWEDLFQTMFDFAVEQNSRTIAFELTGLEMWGKTPCMQQAKDRNLKVQWYWLEARDRRPDGNWGTGKDAVKRARAGMMLPHYKLKECWHHERLKNSLWETALIAYPKPRKWDLLDTGGHAIKIIDTHGQFFDHAVEKQNEMRFEDDDEEDAWDAMLQNGEWRLWK